MVGNNDVFGMKCGLIMKWNGHGFKTRWLTWLLVTLPLLAGIIPPAIGDVGVASVLASQRAGTKLVDIYYEVTGGIPPMSVTVQVSNNAGTTYGVAASSFSGDVGTGLQTGSGRHIVWDAGADWNQNVSNAIRFKVVAENVGLASPQLVTPSNGLTTLVRRINFSWNPVQYADSYRLTIMQRNQVVVTSIVTGTSFQTASNLTLGTYQWFVTARSGESEGPPSGVWQFSIIEIIWGDFCLEE